MKKTLGRQKIEIKKLEKKSSKQVTFSKRRAGLFKKAAELSVLCGAEIAILVFSPNDKLFCFGHPAVDVLLEKFLIGNLSSPPLLPPPLPAEAYIPVAEFNREFAESAAELEAEKRRAADVVTAAAEARNRGGMWWETAVEGMRVDELKEFRSALIDLRGRVAEKIEKLSAFPMFPPLPPPLPPFHLSGNYLHCGLGFGIDQYC